jgi:hypothetical protein
LSKVVKKKLQPAKVTVTGSVKRAKRFRRRIAFSKCAVLGVVAIAVLQLFVGLPARLPLPLWASLVLASVLFLASLCLGGIAIRTIVRIEHYGSE